MRPRHVVAGLLGAALMLFVILGSVYPVPKFPFNILPYLFLAYMLVGTWFTSLRARCPHVLTSILHDMEA
jgi:Na+/alanine symporter